MTRYASPAFAGLTLILGFAWFLHAGFGVTWAELLHAPGWDARWLMARAV